MAAGFVHLVRFLLKHGASPHHKNGLAIHAAIRRKDLALVKMLIEPDSAPPVNSDVIGAGQVQVGRSDATVALSKKRIRSDIEIPSKSAKRRKLEDRVTVDREMLKTAVACNAQDIVVYFVHEKSCVPDMQTLKLMRSIGL